MKTITSKLSPPTTETHMAYIYQTRDGRHINYECGGTCTEHERKRECGGCTFCLGEISVVNVFLKASWGSSRPTFRRWPCEPCPTCKPKLERLDEIDRLIYELNKEKNALL